MQISPKQLLVLVLVACRDSGYSVVGRQRVTEILWNMCNDKSALVPTIVPRMLQEQPFSRQLVEVYDTLCREGNRFDSITGTIEISDEMSDADLFKPLFEEQRQELDRYAGEFVQRLVTVHRAVAI